MKAIDHQHDAELIIRFGIEIKQCPAVVVLAFMPDAAPVRRVLDAKAVGRVAVNKSPEAGRVPEQAALQQGVREFRKINDIGLPASARQLPGGTAGDYILQNVAALGKAGALAGGLAQRGHAQRNPDRVVDPVRVALTGAAFDG